MKSYKAYVTYEVDGTGERKQYDTLNVSARDNMHALSIVSGWITRREFTGATGINIKEV